MYGEEMISRKDAKEQRTQRALAVLLTLTTAASLHAKDFSGARALEFTRKAVAFGPRPPGSPALRKLQSYIVSELKLRRCEIQQDDFTAQTPKGPIAMKNIVARFPGSSGRAVAITGHYDTKLLPGFVGANDGGSSTGFLLEMAQALQDMPHKDDILLVWLDGEEAFADWTATDSLYGSRHLAAKWASDGTIARIKALINVDMIGDKDLGILQEGNSSPALRKLVWDTAQRIGYAKYFLSTGSHTEDDHIPFLRVGVNALDLIDFDYPPWHTPGDTMDKLSAHSLQVVGDVLMAVWKQLEAMR
jgi:glutaminyl-peptide cyclotransferase